MEAGRKAGLWAGAIIFIAMILAPPPASMTVMAWHVSALVLLMAIYWMTQALPLTVTALLPFVALPAMNVMTAGDVASEYYSPILFLILGGAFLALAIERAGLHRRVALGILSLAGKSDTGLLIAVMAATAILSMIISNTSTSLIMVPIAVAILSAGGMKEKETHGMAGALLMGIAFAASIGGLGTLVGSPTNAIAAGLVNKQLGININFLTWMKYGIPVVLLSIPVCAFILIKVQRLSDSRFDTAAARTAIGNPGPWSRTELRLLPVIILIIGLWMAQPLIEPLFPKGAVTDGTIAIFGSTLLFIIPDGSGSRPLLNWDEANRAPWGVIMMFGGGLALAAGISESGLAGWLGEALRPLAAVHPLFIAVAIVALIILITEFASNVATASGIIPVIAALVSATGADPWLLAMAASMAASWGFMLPSGTGPNAIAWATDHIALPKMLRAGFLLDLAGIPLLVGTLWLMGNIIHP